MFLEGIHTCACSSASFKMAVCPQNRLGSVALALTEMSLVLKIAVGG